MLLFTITVLVGAVVCDTVTSDGVNTTPDISMLRPRPYLHLYNNQPYEYPDSPNRFYGGRPPNGRTLPYRQNHGNRYPFTRLQYRNPNYGWPTNRYQMRYPY
ncbi:hypothetical protein D918_08103 [Trichuris suis]|nr:hypothetical protein D918_08103 [Trichuris suis]